MHIGKVFRAIDPLMLFVYLEKCSLLYNTKCIYYANDQEYLYRNLLYKKIVDMYVNSTVKSHFGGSSATFISHSNTHCFTLDKQL